MPKKRHDDIYWTLTDVASEIGINLTTLLGRIVAGVFPEPTHSPGKSRRRYYTDAEVREILSVHGKEVE